MDIDHEDDMPKKRGRLDRERSAIDDVEMARPPDEDVVTMESPLSDIPSSTESDIEPPDTTQPLPQNAASDTEHVSERQAPDERGQQQSDALFVSPEAGSPPLVPVGLDEGNPSIYVSSEPIFQVQHALTKAVGPAPPHSPRRHASHGGSRRDNRSVSLNVYRFRCSTHFSADVSWIANNIAS